MTVFNVATVTFEELLLPMTHAAAEKRGRMGESLRVVKKVPAKFVLSQNEGTKDVTIIGRSRITEALARHFNLLSYNVRAIGPDLKPGDYPAMVQCSCIDDGYDEIQFR
jgi:hypothetical protein